MVSYIEKWENWVALGKDVKNISGFNKTFSYDCTLYFCTTFVSQDIGIFLFHLFFSLTKRCKKSFPWHCMNHLYTFWWQGGARCKNPCKDILLLIFLVSCKDVFFTLRLWAAHIRQIRTMCPPPPGEARHISEGGRPKFGITVIPSLLSQIIVVPVMIVMKLLIFISMTCLKYLNRAKFTEITVLSPQNFQIPWYRTPFQSLLKSEQWGYDCTPADFRSKKTS